MDSTGKMSPAELLAIGEILKPRGVRGELKVRLLCSDFDDFLDCLEAGDLFLWWTSGNVPVNAPDSPKNLPVMSAAAKGTSAQDTNKSSPREQLSQPQLLAGAPYLIEAESVRFHAGFALLQITGIETLDDAERLRGAMIGLQAADIPQPEDDSFYQFQLEGLRVVTMQGEPVGTVESIQENPAHDLLIIQPPASGQKPFMLPLVEAFIKRVDLQAGLIEVDLPKGLIEPTE